MNRPYGLLYSFATLYTREPFYSEKEISLYVFYQTHFFEIVATYFYPKLYMNTASLVEYGGNIRKNPLNFKYLYDIILL